MKFVEEPNPSSGIVRTICLGAGLLLTIGFVGTIIAPKVLQAETDRSPTSIVGCIEGPDGERLFGKTISVPIGNPFTVHRANRGKHFLATSAGQQIIFHRENDLTNLIVRAHGPLTSEQSAYLQSCAPPPKIW